jgi:hypothetical protein
MTATGFSFNGCCRCCWLIRAPLLISLLAYSSLFHLAVLSCFEHARCARETREKMAVEKAGRCAQFTLAAVDRNADVHSLHSGMCFRTQQGMLQLGRR